MLVKVCTSMFTTVFMKVIGMVQLLLLLYNLLGILFVQNSKLTYIYILKIMSI